MANTRKSKVSKSTTKSNIHEELDSFESGVNSQACSSNNTKLTNSNSSSNSKTSIPNAQVSRFNNPSTLRTKFDEKLDEIISSSIKNEFKKSIFKIDDETKELSPIYDFYECQRNFSTIEAFKKPIKFRCIICNDDDEKNEVTTNIGKNTNLVHHLKKHEVFNSWKKRYDEFQNLEQKEKGIFEIKIKVNNYFLNIINQFRN